MDRWQDDLIGAVSGDSASEREVFEWLPLKVCVCLFHFNL